MAKGDIYVSDVKQINEHVFEVASKTSDRTYRIDSDVPHCTCEGFARMYNTSKRDGADPPVGYCKHLTAVQQGIRSKHFNATVPKKVKVERSAPGLTDKEKTNIRWRSEKARLELEDDLADLRGDSA